LGPRVVSADSAGLIEPGQARLERLAKLRVGADAISEFRTSPRTIEERFRRFLRDAFAAATIVQQWMCFVVSSIYACVTVNEPRSGKFGSLAQAGDFQSRPSSSLPDCNATSCQYAALKFAQHH
jgi:hypothetical protein